MSITRIANSCSKGREVFEMLHGYVAKRTFAESDWLLNTRQFQRAAKLLEDAGKKLALAYREDKIGGEASISNVES